MTKVASRLLTSVYAVPGFNVQVIPHGVPQVPWDGSETHKVRLGLAGRRVVCTFGLINRGKGLEYMIAAMPRIVAAFPEVLYLIVGATHPEVKHGREKSTGRAWSGWPRPWASAIMFAS